MNGDELAAALYAEQGYLIIATRKPKAVGYINTDKSLPLQGIEPALTPLRVIGDATLEEFKKQSASAQRMMGENHIDDFDGYKFFYRVEAAD